MAKVFKTDESFEKVFKEYFNPLVNFVNSKINNWEDSREIVQNTFLKIWEVRHKLDIDTSLKSYLYRATKNGMIDFIRLKKRNTALKEDIKADSSEIDSHQYDGGVELNAYIIRQELNKALKVLKPKNREIFMLHKSEGLTHSEIAQYLGISIRAVEDNVKRATLTLREVLSRNKGVFE